MKIHEIEEGDTVIIKHYDANAEHKLENVMFGKVKFGQHMGHDGNITNFIRFVIASTKFNVKSDTQISIDDDEPTSTEGVN